VVVDVVVEVEADLGLRWVVTMTRDGGGVGGRISDFRECWKLNHQAK
jgi:hypothetical protein